MELTNFEPLFGEPKVDDSSAVRPFLFQVHAPDPCQLRVHVTDFFATSFEALRSIQQLDDMRDETGVGGSCSDFLQYLVHSIKFGDVKLVFEGQSKSNGPDSARLIAQKSKGMPRISVSLIRLVGTAANEAMAKLSIDMYKFYKSNHKLLLEEQEGRHQLTKKLSAEQFKLCIDSRCWCMVYWYYLLFSVLADHKNLFICFQLQISNTLFTVLCVCHVVYQEKSERMQKQLDGLLYSSRHNSQKAPDKLASVTSSDISERQSDQNPSPMKAPKRAVPAHRRSKVRGVLLQDTEED
ncbi:uncharacterized protein LOC143622526 [Bidens hawaiensis]|uniref:uncharacterized protein LOC143622526 n=1 Tax=Bidens hawaiensis TaxID=980011 RepID=UPI00404930AF